MAGSFLQSAQAQVLKNLVLSESNVMTDEEREEITSFLSNPFSQGYAAQSGQIVGMLKQMSERMTKDLDAATKAEEKAIANYEALMKAKTKEVNACTKEIEDKMVRLGNLQVEIVEMKEDLDDTSKAMLEDKKFLANMEKDCATKTKENEANMKLRGEELLALAETIKIL